MPDNKASNKDARKNEKVEKITAVTEEKAVSDHFFPYNLFRQGERVVIYGAGDIGKQFYLQAQRDEYVEIVGILDARAKNINASFNVSLPEEIVDMEYDSVLIAVNKKKVVASVKRTLRNLGVPREKIKCNSDIYYYEHFYQSFYKPLLEILAPEGASHEVILVGAREMKNFLTEVAGKLGTAAEREACLQKLDEKLLFSHRHIFPYHLFKENERVIIYGAGDIGREFYQETRQQPFVKVLALVDKNADKMADYPMPVTHIDNLEHYAYDSILISIHDEYVAREVKDMLVKRGIPEEKIKWDGYRYYKDEFYQNYYFKNLRFLAGLRKSSI